MSSFADYNFAPIQVGETFDALPFTVDRDPTNLANLASVSVEFESSCPCKNTFTWAGTITNAATWAFTLPAITTIDYEVGHYVGMFVFTDVNGRVKKYLRGIIDVVEP